MYSQRVRDGLLQPQSGSKFPRMRTVPLIDTLPKLYLVDQNLEASSRALGWMGKFYKLFSRLEFTRKQVVFSKDLSVIQNELHHGHIKVSGVIEEGGLSISFYEGLSIGINGNRITDSVFAISYDKCNWSSFAKAPAVSLVLQISPDLAEKILSPEAHSYLMSPLHNQGNERHSYVSLITPAANALKKALSASIKIIEESSQRREDIFYGAWVADDIVSLVECLVDQTAMVKRHEAKRGNLSHFNIAKEVEKMLWLDPALIDQPSISLDYLADYFNCSRRTIQLAIQDQFGIGFTALKRCIRLHQANSHMSKLGEGVKVTEIAGLYDFDHLGRFSSYYKDMFGELPSKQLRNKVK